MSALKFLKSPAGNLLALLAFVGVGAFLIYRSNQREKAEASQVTTVDSKEPASLRESILRKGAALKIFPSETTKSPPQKGTNSGHGVTPSPSTQPGVSSDRTSTRPRVLPLSLLSSPAPSVTESRPLSKTYAPYGRLIPCETVVTLESSRLDTPVIGLVTEDVWHNGVLVIPVGTEVHGRASVDRSRERIAITGKWVVVWRDSSPLNGTELVLSGIALEREKDDVSGEFGLRDGSAGLVGQLVKSDDWQEIKLFASTFLAGAASGLQELQTQNTAVGLSQVPVASGRTAALEGTAAVLNAYAHQIQEAISRDGFFVRVPAGKQFYLYVTETIDQSAGARANVANAEIWKNAHEKN